LDRQSKKRTALMAHKVKVWYDAEGDFMEVAFSDEAGSMRETANDAVMERVNKDGQVIGFSILGVGKLSKEKPLEAELVDA
jgi:uncharacterized protein YuzE